MKDKIIIKNAIKRKPYWVYYITKEGDIGGYDIREKELKKQGAKE